jgi:hypothetical protein
VGREPVALRSSSSWRCRQRWPRCATGAVVAQSGGGGAVGGDGGRRRPSHGDLQLYSAGACSRGRSTAGGFSQKKTSYRSPAQGVHLEDLLRPFILRWTSTVILCICARAELVYQICSPISFSLLLFLSVSYFFRAASRLSSLGRFLQSLVTFGLIFLVYFLAAECR